MSNTNSHIIENEVTDLYNQHYKSIIFLLPIYPMLLLTFYKIGLFAFWNISVEYIQVSYFEGIIAAFVGFMILFASKHIHVRVISKIVALAMVAICLLSAALLILSFLNNPSNTAIVTVTPKDTFSELRDLLFNFKITLVFLFLAFISQLLIASVKGELTKLIAYVLLLLFMLFGSAFLGYEITVGIPSPTIVNDKYIIISKYEDSFITSEIQETIITDNYYSEITSYKGSIYFVPIAETSLRRIEVGELKFVRKN